MPRVLLLVSMGLLAGMLVLRLSASDEGPVPEAPLFAQADPVHVLMGEARDAWVLVKPRHTAVQRSTLEERELGIGFCCEVIVENRGGAPLELDPRGAWIAQGDAQVPLTQVNPDPDRNAVADSGMGQRAVWATLLHGAGGPLQPGHQRRMALSVDQEIQWASVRSGSVFGVNLTAFEVALREVEEQIEVAGLVRRTGNPR